MPVFTIVTLEMNMDRQEAIDTIKKFYPPDSECQNTRNVGQDLLREVISDCSWTELPTELLLKLARKNIQLERGIMAQLFQEG